MNRKLLALTLVLTTASALAADSSPKDDVTSAAKALGDKPNYSWRTTVVVPESDQFKPGPTDGKLEKDGFTSFTLAFGDNTTDVVKKGDKAAIKSADQDWQSLTELEGQEGFGRFFAAIIRNLKAPDAQAADIVAGAKEIKKDGDVYTSDLTEKGAKDLLAFRGFDATITNPSGSAKFWVKDGVLTKFEFKVKGTVSFGGNDMEVDRDTTTEIKEVGTTKVTVSDDAKKKI